MARTDAGPDKREQIGRMRWHGRDRGADHVGQRTFLAGMNQRNGRTNAIHKKHGRTVGASNHQQKPDNRRDQSIHTGIGAGGGDESDAVAVSLFRPRPLLVAKSGGKPLFVVVIASGGVRSKCKGVEQER